MSWIRDVDNDLHNLDHVQSITIEELARNEGDSLDLPTHGVFISFPAGDKAEVAVFTGTEDECVEHRVLLAKKLHFVGV